jgi:hypothetical protein
MGIRRVTPLGRSATWAEGEVVRIVKIAWRMGYRGLAVIVAIAWDTGFSPVDARRLATEHMSTEGFRIPRAKTGKPAIGTVSPRTRRLVESYLKDLPETVVGAPLFRNRTGAAYSKDTLGDDFRAVRAAVFPGDTRKLMDTRRSGAVEALARAGWAPTKSAGNSRTASRRTGNLSGPICPEMPPSCALWTRAGLWAKRPYGEQESNRAGPPILTALQRQRLTH